MKKSMDGWLPLPTKLTGPYGGPRLGNSILLCFFFFLERKIVQICPLRRISYLKEGDKVI